MWISVRTLICIEKLLFQLASVPTSQQPVQTTLSDQALDFFTSSNMGRLQQPSGRRGFPSERTTPKGKNRNSNSTIRTSVCHGPDGHSPSSEREKPYIEITYSGHVTVRTRVPHRPDAALKQEIFSAKITKILVAQLSVRTAHVHRPDGVCTYHSSHPFEPSAYK
jgi:hypothetical protein